MDTIEPVEGIAINAAVDAVKGADDKLTAHLNAVSLVRQEAEYMSASGDLMTSDAARRVLIVAEAVEYVLTAVKEAGAKASGDPTYRNVYADSPFDKQIDAIERRSTADVVRTETPAYTPPSTANIPPEANQQPDRVPTSYDPVTGAPIYSDVTNTTADPFA